ARSTRVAHSSGDTRPRREGMCNWERSLMPLLCRSHVEGRPRAALDCRDRRFRQSTQGGRATDSLHAAQRYGGALYPINPARSRVQGLKAFPRLEDLPQAPELAVVAVAGEEAVRAVQACAVMGVKAAIVMASGFGETGEAGRKAQDDMLQAARKAGMRLIGP